MSKEQPLPFIYQFAAGAVAGLSEVSPGPPKISVVRAAMELANLFLRSLLCTFPHVFKAMRLSVLPFRTSVCLIDIFGRLGTH